MEKAKKAKKKKRRGNKKRVNKQTFTRGKVLRCCVEICYPVDMRSSYHQDVTGLKTDIPSWVSD